MKTKFCIYLYDVQCCLELMWFAYFLDCIPFWIQLLLHPRQNENESRPPCLKRHGLEELNHHNTFQSWVMYLKHHHKWSRNHIWKVIYLVFSFTVKGIIKNLLEGRVWFNIKIYKDDFYWLWILSLLLTPFLKFIFFIK